MSRALAASWNGERRRQQAQGGGDNWRRDGNRRGDDNWRRDDDRREGDAWRDRRRGDRQYAGNNRDDDYWRHGRRDEERWRRWRHTHRDWDRPRYRDWHSVRHSHYFDRGYAVIVGGFYGHNYYWWGYDGWRRPYRRWAVGYYLPDYIYWEPIPYDLYYRLPPAPYGCRYVLVDRDILLIVVSTGLILDALLYY